VKERQAALTAVQLAAFGDLIPRSVAGDAVFNFFARCDLGVASVGLVASSSGETRCAGDGCFKGPSVAAEGSGRSGRRAAAIGIHKSLRFGMRVLNCAPIGGARNTTQLYRNCRASIVV